MEQYQGQLTFEVKQFKHGQVLQQDLTVYQNPQKRFVIVEIKVFCLLNGDF